MEVTAADFLKAAEEGRLEDVQAIVADGMSVDEEEDGETALWAAMRFLSSTTLSNRGAAVLAGLDVARWLIQAGADISVTERYNCTILMAAVMSENFEFVEYVVSEWARSSANIDAIDDNGQSALSYACCLNDLTVMDLLFKQGAKAENVDFLNVIEVGNGDRGFTNSDAVRWLVEHGVDIHKTNEYGITAFDTAVRYGRLDIIKFLEQLPEASRVNVESIVKHGYNLRNALYDEDHMALTVMQFLADRGDGDMETPLMRICNRSFKVCERTPHHYEIMDWLLEIGTDINATDEIGNSALSNAVAKSDIDLAKWLLVRGVDIDDGLLLHQRTDCAEMKAVLMKEMVQAYRRRRNFLLFLARLQLLPASAPLPILNQAENVLGIKDIQREIMRFL